MPVRAETIETHARLWAERVGRDKKVSELSRGLAQSMQATSQAQAYQVGLLRALVTVVLDIRPTGITLPTMRWFLDAASLLPPQYCGMACERWGRALARQTDQESPPEPFGSLLLHCSCSLPDMSLAHRLSLVATLTRMSR